jgi:hypothetical protein
MHDAGSKKILHPSRETMDGNHTQEVLTGQKPYTPVFDSLQKSHSPARCANLFGTKQSAAGAVAMPANNAHTAIFLQEALCRTSIPFVVMLLCIDTGKEEGSLLVSAQTTKEAKLCEWCETVAMIFGLAPAAPPRHRHRSSSSRRSNVKRTSTNKPGNQKIALNARQAL